MAICIPFQNDTCLLGDKCQFSHEHIVIFQAKAGKEAQDWIKEIAGQTLKLSMPTSRMLNGLGKLMGVIQVSVLESVTKTEGDIKIESYETLASYNWKNVGKPTIYVPGCPPEWSPPATPITLSRDRGRVYVDQNGHRSPGAPFDPLFQALLHMHPDYNMKPISLVTDRNSLRKLLKFAFDQSDTWRIDVDVVEDTMFFTRWETKCVKFIPQA